MNARQLAVLNDRYQAPGERSIKDTWDRVARSLASDEDEARQFRAILDGFQFVPGGRILAGAGLGERATLGNCFVLPIEDTRESIFCTLGQAMNILSKGGGVGINFSPLRPKGTKLISSRGIASGPTSFATVFDRAAHTIVQGGSRRAALMFIINADHPDADEFLTYKETVIQRLNLRQWNGSQEALADIWPWSHANVSVGIGDDFVRAVQEDSEFRVSHPKSEQISYRSAREMLRTLARYAWGSGDPGIINFSAINHQNNTQYFEQIECTNPCGEIPLPPYGVCFLGAINLAVVDHITPDMAYTIVRLMNRVVDLSYYVLPECKERALLSRRIGIGVMGLAERLIHEHILYGSDQAIEFTKAIFQEIRDHLYEASVRAAKEDGPFPAFARAYLDSPFIQKLPGEIRKGIARYGIRNACLLAQAPTGTTSALAGTSSGIEPYFSATEMRTDGTGTYLIANPHAHHPAFITAGEVDPMRHLLMQAAAQEFIDQSISKTINLPNSATVDDIYHIYLKAIELGLKGITIYRDGCTGFQVIHHACPSCGHKLTPKEGCQTCEQCGWSACDVT